MEKRNKVIIFLFLLLFMISLISANEKELSKEINKINKIISEDNLEWEAGETSMSDLSLDEKKALLLQNKINLSGQNVKKRVFSMKSSYPSSLDWRDKDGKNWITPIRNQGSCGSCWAFAVVSVIESKINIELNNSDFDADLSEQDLVSCSKAGSCSGGDSYMALNYTQINGIARESCFQYTAADISCSLCPDYENNRVNVPTYLLFTDPFSIKQAINVYGPVTVYMAVYDDFYHYKSGIYRRISGANHLGFHAISIVGYNDVEQYWIAKNSWGTDWGESGFFRIDYSENVLDFEFWNPTLPGEFFLDENYAVTSVDINSFCSPLPTNTTWSGWNNITDSVCSVFDVILQNRTRLEYDANYDTCYGLTNLSSDLWNFGQNITYIENQNLSCDFCMPNWAQVLDSDKVWFNDTNACYDQTFFDFDMLDRPNNVSLRIENNLTILKDGENGKPILELNFNITEYPLNLSSFKLLQDDNSSLYSWAIVQGLNISLNESFRKAIYLDRKLASGLICIKDEEIDNIENISSYCNSSSEILFNSCPKIIDNYSCEIYNESYKISGLMHSGIKEQTPFCGDGVCNNNEGCSDCSADCGSCPVSGSGGGGSSTKNRKSSNKSSSLGIANISTPEINIIDNSSENTTISSSNETTSTPITGKTIEIFGNERYLTIGLIILVIIIVAGVYITKNRKEKVS